MTLNLTIEDIYKIGQALRSRDLDLSWTSDFGGFCHNSVANLKRWGTRKYGQMLNLFSSQQPKNICGFSYIVGERTKQRWVTAGDLIRFLQTTIQSSPFAELIPFLKRVLKDVSTRAFHREWGSRDFYSVLQVVCSAIWNTHLSRGTFRILGDVLIIATPFEYKRFLNCDREYEVDGLAPMSGNTRDFVIRMMNVNASDIDQVSSTPTIFLQLLDRAVLEAELDDRHHDVAELERGRIHLQNALKRKENGEEGLKEMLNPTMYGSREYLNDKDMNGIHSLLRDYVRIVGGFQTFGYGARSWLSHQILNIEHKLQRTFERHLSDMGIKTLSHIYDGCIVLGHPTSEQIKEAERMTVEETGFQMTWKIKKTWNQK